MTKRCTKYKFLWASLGYGMKFKSTLNKTERLKWILWASLCYGMKFKSTLNKTERLKWEINSKPSICLLSTQF